VFSATLLRLPRVSGEVQVNEEDEPVPYSVHRGEKDLGWILLDIDYSGDEHKPQFLGL